MINRAKHTCCYENGKTFLQWAGGNVHVSPPSCQGGTQNRVSSDPVGDVELSAVSFTNLALTVQENDISIPRSAQNNL